MSSELLLCLKWRKGFLTQIPPRVAPLGEETVTPMHSDDMGLGHIGAKWRFGQRDYIAHCHIPEWFLKMQYKNKSGKLLYVGIAEFEMVATILAAIIVAAMPKNIRPCVNLRIDNIIALQAVISGNSKTDLRAKLAQVFWRINLRPNAIFWMEFVPSAAIGADPHLGEAYDQAKRKLI